VFADDQPYTRKSSTLLGLGKGSGREAGGAVALHRRERLFLQLDHTQIVHDHCRAGQKQDHTYHD